MISPQESERRFDRLDSSLATAREALLRLQREDGHWCGELEGDSILESEYLLLLYFLGRGVEPRAHKLAARLRRKQLESGGWSPYAGGEADVNATVKAYFALKLVGDDADSDAMRRARSMAQRLGGLEACNSYTKLYLAIFGQYPWNRCPAVPPEMILLPQWSPFNIYAMSAWTRTIVVPLSMIWAQKPHCEVPPHAAIDELSVEGARAPRTEARNGRERAWVALFAAIDQGLKWVEVLGLVPFRRLALKRCAEWIHQRLPASEGLAAIFPPIVNTVFALTSYDPDGSRSAIAQQLGELEKLEIEEDGALRVEPCKSPVWDTAQGINALVESGVDPTSTAVRDAAAWLLGREVRLPGDCQLRHPDVPVGGWYFEYANEFYPDCDDTAEVVTALSRVQHADSADEIETGQAVERAVDWLVAMQNADGGWASFDRGCDMEALTLIPFADHNAMIDPSTVDITGRVIEALVASGMDPDSDVVRRGARFIVAEQEEDGSWYGRWGANYLYGTWLALTGLAAADSDEDRAARRLGAEWLLAHQNRDGGWGESLRSYADLDWKGRGESAASQTAWALLGLVAAGEASSPAVEAGVDYLLETQTVDSAWHENQWTGTGFPRVFYLKYHYYATYFPLLALASYRRAQVEVEGEKVA